MFELMEVNEFIYESVVEPSYKQYTRADSTRVGHSRKKIGQVTLSHTYSAMGERSIK